MFIFYLIPTLISGLLFAGANKTWRGKAVDRIEEGVLTSYEVSKSIYQTINLKYLLPAKQDWAIFRKQKVCMGYKDFKE